MKKQNLKKGLAKFVVNATKKYVEMDVNAACPWFNHQDKLPKKADEMRKYK